MLPSRCVMLRYRKTLIIVEVLSLPGYLARWYTNLRKTFHLLGRWRRQDCPAL